ncbi:hypothetical protein ABMY26_23810 [Azospirillum sp. HJ39]|uniref:hypothetical protein n=1 Tax=Azospirillum sp. HJ39 TaxID=3159496 RepID=UPI0035572104
MARSREARMIDRRGALVVLRRPSSTIPPTFTDVIVKAFWMETGSDTLAGNAAQRKFSVIIAADTLAETAFPAGGPAKGDHVIIKPTINNGVWTGGGQMLTVDGPGERPTGWWMEAKG